jgi:two-component system sensor histidine kinase/response regulator
VFHFTARFGLNARETPHEVQAAATLGGIRLLIVDDNATNRRILQEVVSRWGMQPAVAGGGAAAIQMIKQERNRGKGFPLILLDANMPEVDGFALARMIRQDPTLAGVAIMMLSSSGLHDDAKRCRELGISTYLIKPINQIELRQAILKTLGATPQPELHNLATAVSAGAPPPVEASRSLRVLLAEDNLVNQKLIIHLLEKRGHSVTVAPDGVAAVEASKQETFDLVLMDVQMPQMGGFEATRIIRALEAPNGRRLPIIALTAHAMKGDRERCLEAGMDDYLSKPIQPKALFKAIGRATELSIQLPVR